MSELIWDFNEFMQRDFKSISLGLTPSGHLHLGFLSTLACALMYLKEHPKTILIITNVENSLASRLEKYNNIPLRFQYIVDGQLIVPSDYTQLKKRNLAVSAIHVELTNLIWQLVQIFDKKTSKEIKAIKKAFIAPKHKKWLELKEHKIFHAFTSQIYIYSFLRVLQHDKSFTKKIIKYLTDYEFAKQVGPLCGMNPKINNFGDKIQIGEKRYQAKGFQVPIRLYCQNCHDLCPDWAMVVLGHPYHTGPTFAAPCRNYGNCPRADRQAGYDGIVYHNLKDSLDMAEFHFMLDPMRDFFNPFKSECHIFGGDYFQLEYKVSGQRAIDKIKVMFEYMEKKTGQSKYFFGGPLITMGGKKMSKSEASFNLKDIKNIDKVFINIVSILEKSRSQIFPNGMQLEYTEILQK